MGGLFYPNESSIVVFGSKSGTTRTSVALTTAYAANLKVIETEDYAQLTIDVLYTTGAAETNNSIEIRLEDSIDRTNFYQLTNEAASGGTSTLTQREFTFVGASAGTAYAFSYRVDITYPFMRLAVKESGVAANAGTVFMEATLGGA